RVLKITGGGPYSVTIAGGIPPSPLGAGITADPQGLIYAITSATGVVTTLENQGYTNCYMRGLTFIAQGGASNLANGLTLWSCIDADIDVKTIGFGESA